MFSIHTRLVLAASLVLIAFLGLTGFILDRAFRDSAIAGLRDRLQTHTYALLAAADVAADGQLRLPTSLPEARFSTPGSGLYAEINSAGIPLWRSPSTLGLDISFANRLEAGERRFQDIRLADGAVLSALSFGIEWEIAEGAPQSYTFSVAESQQGLNAEVGRFRRSLWGWLGGVALLLLAVQGSILRWSLAPLRQVTTDLGEMEAGRSAELTGQYPRELRGLTDNLNALMRHERAHLERYRHTLDDLAHSLKTPLAVLRGVLSGARIDEEMRTEASEQVERMSQIVSYQLQRAATSGRTTFSTPVAFARSVRQLVASLDKVYADKNVITRLAVDEDILFYGDEGDLLELLGNLLDNAYKCCRRKVELSAHALHDETQRRAGLEFSIDDDGPGIAAEMAQRVLQRGIRMDTANDGQGIGLAVVRDIVRIYRGRLDIGDSPLGGARLTVSLPCE